jgi:aspartate carbamoyltransferase catalytic subunit
VTVVAPRTLLPPDTGDQFADAVTDRLDDVLGDVDVLYLLRMQQERMNEALVANLREYTARFGRTPKRAARLPVSTVSASSRPGSRRCTCRSTNPGLTTRPDASIT